MAYDISVWKKDEHSKGEILVSLVRLPSREGLLSVLIYWQCRAEVVRILESTGKQLWVREGYSDPFIKKEQS